MGFIVRPPAMRKKTHTESVALRTRDEKICNDSMRKQTTYFLTKQFTKNKYDMHEPKTTTELHTLDLVRVHIEGGEINHVRQRPFPIQLSNLGHWCYSTT